MKTRRPHGYWNVVIAKLNEGDRVTIGTSESSSIYRVAREKGIRLRAFQNTDGTTDVWHCGFETREPSKRVARQIEIEHRITPKANAAPIPGLVEPKPTAPVVLDPDPIDEWDFGNAPLPRLQPVWFRLDENAFSKLIGFCRSRGISTGRFIQEAVISELQRNGGYNGNV